MVDYRISKKYANISSFTIIESVLESDVNDKGISTEYSKKLCLYFFLAQLKYYCRSNT